jgi:hypothetical protein
MQTCSFHCQRSLNNISSHFTTLRSVNPLNAKLNPTCHLLALLGAYHILHVSGLRVNINCQIVSVFFRIHGNADNLVATRNYNLTSTIWSFV